MTPVLRGAVKALTAGLALLVVAASPGRAATFTLSDVTDGSAASNNNFQTALPPDIGNPFLMVAKFGTFEQRAALEFDLSSLSPGAVVTRAKLELFFAAADALIGVHGATGDGLITPADFTFAGQIATFDPTILVRNSVDVTSFIAGMVGTHFVVFQLRELASDFNAIDSGTAPPSFAPHLVITTPGPAPLLLVGMGLAGLGAISWRRRR
jgi:hypothetical protein